MKKNGFTLVELIAVLIIILLIAMISLPIIIGKLKEIEPKIDEVTEKIIYTGVANYIDYNKGDYPMTNNATYCITLNQIVTSGHLVSPIVTSSGDTVNLTRKVRVTVNGNTFVFDLLSESESLSCG